MFKSRSIKYLMLMNYDITLIFFSSSDWLINTPFGIIVEICRGVANSLDKRLGGVDSGL